MLQRRPTLAKADKIWGLDKNNCLFPSSESITECSDGSESLFQHRISARGFLRLNAVFHKKVLNFADWPSNNIHTSVCGWLNQAIIQLSLTAWTSHTQLSRVASFSNSGREVIFYAIQHIELTIYSWQRCSSKCFSSAMLCNTIQAMTDRRTSIDGMTPTLTSFWRAAVSLWSMEIIIHK